jgi:ATP-dependent DNA helicase RecG
VLDKGRKLSELVGERTAKSFARHLSLSYEGELLEHYPRRYAKRGQLTNISALPVGEVATVVGEVVKVSSRYTKGRAGSILEVVITDGTSLMTLAFFNQAWRKDQIKEGMRGFFSGKVGIFSGKLQLTHPDYELFEDADEKKAKAWAELPIPIYPASGTIPSWKIQKAVAQVIDSAEISELIPEKLLASDCLLSLNQAIRQIHLPTTDSEHEAARKSLKYHEALLLQLGLLQSRATKEADSALVLAESQLAIQFDKQLGFQYTEGQQAVISEIAGDLSSGHPMHRLLQGEVGSGKTVVAIRTVLHAAAEGHQSALLAPTEVLAEQHYNSTVKTLGRELADRLGVRLLKGSLSTAERKKAMLDIASGKCLLAIGTHALIAEKVNFADLGLVIIDEQHRFGVGQRELLRGKAKKPPHVLTMTATPIPRTVAITTFGNLDISTLTELPAGRQDIETFVVPISKPALVSRVWARVAEEIKTGRQAFVVCPRIAGSDYDDSVVGESETPPAAAEEVFESLNRNPALAGMRLGLLHGQLSSEEKADVMDAFSAGEVDLLVSTTVIEVGVNIPNATAMVVLDADRFGISQLHQLRGRVGRGSHSGICLLISSAEDGTIASQRLDALAATRDGFKLSELDLELRGEGDVLGDNQSGRKSQLKLLRVTKDAELIKEARGIAQALIVEGLGEVLTAKLAELEAEALERS